MKKLYKFLSIILTVCLLIGALPMSAFAAENNSYKTVTKEVELSVGEQEKLNANVFFGKTLWETSDDKIVSVSNDGVVTAVAEGDAIVTANTKIFKGYVKKSIFNVHVINRDKITVNVGDTLQLELSSTGDKVTWTSENKEIATVSASGLVTGVSEGSVKITAKIQTGKKFWFFWIPNRGTTKTEVFNIDVVDNNQPEPEPEPDPETKVYTVTFETNGGTEIDAQSVNEGKNAIEPENPKKEGYLFDGWYTDKECTKSYSFDIEIKEDTVLYAKWIQCVQGSYIVRFNSKGGSFVENQIVTEGEVAEEPEDPEKEGYAFVGWFIDENAKLDDKTFNFRETAIQENIILYALWISTLDTDGDELVDGLEEYYGTDINNVDTDGDGLSDYVEVVLLGTDPLSAEKDENGLTDAEKDSDGDTLSNAYELKIGTNPADKDTDADGLNDDEEIKIGTNPLLCDTDGDGANDGTEIRIGTDPLKADQNFNIKQTSEIKSDIKASVDINLKGDQVDTLIVEPLVNNPFFPEDMPGYMGSAYKFSVDGLFDNATISFEFDGSNLSEEADPVICYFNDQTQELEPLETTIKGSVASAKVTHFSTYVLIDHSEYNDGIEWLDVWEEKETEYDGVEIVLVIDDSGSMGGNDRNYKRLEVAKKLIEELPQNSKYGIISFENSVNVLTDELLIDKNKAKEILNTQNFRSDGGTYMYNAIQESFKLFSEDADSNILKMAVVLSDGDAHDVELHADTINKAKENNVRLYTIGLGTDSEYYFTEYLKPLAEETNALFYTADDADKLTDIFNNINNEIDREVDSDGDGIPDFYEDHVTLFNGKKINLDKNNRDTDGDGLYDGEEVEISIKYNEDKSKVSIKGKIKSYPNKEDSDDDGIKDDIDPEPLNFNVTDYTLSLIEGLSYANFHEYEGCTVKEAINRGAEVKDSDVAEKYRKYLENMIIVRGNNSGKDEKFGDFGVGSVAVRIPRASSEDIVVLAIRGTENADDFFNDSRADIKLGFGWQSAQSIFAYKEYKAVATNRNVIYCVAGHSLGGRLALDVAYKANKYKDNGIVMPSHIATYNGLGYNGLIKATLNESVISKYENKLTNFYYIYDLVGEGLGCEGLFRRPGKNVKVRGDIKYDENKKIVIRNLKKHHIVCFHEDKDLCYKLNYKYWWR